MRAVTIGPAAIRASIESAWSAFLSRGWDVAHLYGGGSHEDRLYVASAPQELAAGAAVESALKALGVSYSVVHPNESALSSDLRGASLVLLNAHGMPGECGRVQGLLDLLHKPYTGSGLLASAIALDKAIMSNLAASLGIATPLHSVMNSPTDFAEAIATVGHQYILKPVDGGSSVGLKAAITDSASSRHSQLTRSDFETYPRWLAQQFVTGRDITAGVLVHRGFRCALPLLEIVSDSGIYGESEKMGTHWSGGVTYRPAAVSSHVEKHIVGAVFRLLDSVPFRGVLRMDFRVDRNEIPYFLEVNTNPGLSRGGNVALAAGWAGLSFEQLIQFLLLSAAHDGPDGTKFATSFRSEPIRGS